MQKIVSKEVLYKNMNGIDKSDILKRLNLKEKEYDALFTKLSTSKYKRF